MCALAVQADQTHIECGYECFCVLLPHLQQQATLGEHSCCSQQFLT